MPRKKADAGKIGELEFNSLWYKYKTKIWLKKTPQTAVVHNMMRVLRAMRNVRSFAYASVPITTGKLLYELKLTSSSMDESAQLELAIERNYHAGWEFIESLKKEKNCPILYPADLVPVHQHWEDIHYQALWLSIIAEKCTEVNMGDGWEYSNGCSEEFTHAFQLKLGLPRHKKLLFFNTKELEETERLRMKNIKVYDHRGNPLTISDGINALEKSIKWLKENHFKTEKLENSLKLLKWTDEKLYEGFYQ